MDHLKALVVITTVNLFLLAFTYILDQLADTVQLDCDSLLTSIQHYEGLNFRGNKLIAEDGLCLKFKVSIPLPQKIIVNNNNIIEKQ